MKIKMITIGRVKNLGNYETMRLEMTAELNDGENVLEATDKLGKLIYFKLNENENDAKFEANKAKLEKLDEAAAKDVLAWNERYENFKAEVEKLDYAN